MQWTNKNMQIAVYDVAATLEIYMFRFAFAKWVSTFLSEGHILCNNYGKYSSIHYIYA